MYLSRLFLNPRSKAVRLDLADCHKLHQRVMSAFPATTLDDNVRERFGVLHRLEVDFRNNRIILYVQSQEEPNWSELEPGYLLGEAEVKRVDRFYRSLPAGAVLAFRLKANPTKRESVSGSGPGGQKRRVGLLQEEEQIGWLQRKGEQGGFVLRGVQMSGLVMEQGKGNQITLATVVFDGHLQITDAAKFYQHTLAHGIGSGKAYGMGLLSLAPL